MAQTTSEVSLKVQQSLEGSAYACSSLQSLSGGTANFVYRATLSRPLEDGTKTIIIKHSEPYVAQNPAFALTVERCTFERALLAAASTLPPTTHCNITIRTPPLYTSPPSLPPTIQLHTDLPLAIDLKTYILTQPLLSRPQCQALGHALGLWTAQFHRWAAAPAQSALRDVMKGNAAMRALKYRINYETLMATVEDFPKILEASRALFQAVKERVREEMDGEDAEREGVLIHGDFWTGNVLLPPTPFPSTSCPDPNPISIYITDFELSHLPSASPIHAYSLDLGQMFAELYSLTHFKSLPAGKWIIEAFVRGYGGMSAALAARTALHTGVHLICWGTRVKGWGTREQVEDVVRVGRDLVVAGWRGEEGRERLREMGWGVFDGSGEERESEV